MKRTWIVGVVAAIAAFGSVSFYARPVMADAKALEAARAKLETVDKQISDERASYWDAVDKAKTEDEKKDLETKHKAKLKELNADRDKAVQAVVDNKGDAATGLKEDLKDVDDKIKHENDRHDDRVKAIKKEKDDNDKEALADENKRHENRMKALKLQKKRVEAAIEETTKKVSKADAATKVEEINKDIAEENQRHEDAIDTINIAKHRIGQALAKVPGGKDSPAAAGLRQSMKEQDQALADENKAFAANMEVLSQRKATLAKIN